MIRHVAFFEPATAYRRPLLCDMHGLVVDVIAACGSVARVELERLIAEQAQDQQDDMARGSL